jgi:hypothetical protein
MVLPNPCGVTLTCTEVLLGGIVTLACTLATLGSRLARFTCKPLGPAGVPIVIVRVPGALNKFRGDGVRPIAFVVAVIVTVDGLLLANPSFTISCTT